MVYWSVPSTPVRNEQTLTIRNCDPIEDKLNVIVVMSNPVQFRTRARLASEFIQRMENEPMVRLHVVELTYSNTKFQITQRDNPRHLQLTTQYPLWHKENLVNCGVRLLPVDWKCFAWIDADIEFENPHWCEDTLRLLNGSKDIVQLWSHCDDMAKDGSTMRIFQSFGYQLTKGRKMVTSGVNMWHPGYAWAITRTAYEHIGGLYDLSILGSGDHNMAMAALGFETLNGKTSDGYRASLSDFRHSANQFRIGYTSGTIRHHFHGSKKNRRYFDRWKILVKYQYDPALHVQRDENGILIPTPSCPPALLRDILGYFRERNEDE
jgi:hypothetical protein